MKGLYLCLFGLCLLLCYHHTKAENILFLSWPLFSHVQGMTFVASELHKFGHTSYFPVTNKLAATFKGRKGIELLPMKDDPDVPNFEKTAINFFAKDSEGSWKDLQKIMHKVCDNMLLDEEWFQSLKAVNATIAVVDLVFMSTCLTIIPYKLSIPFILQGVNNLHYITRVPWLGSAFPYIMYLHSDKMSFQQRLKNSLMTHLSYINPPPGTPSKSVQTYAPDKPEISFDALLRKAALFLIEGDLLLGYPLPTLPNVKYIGGVAAQPSSPLKGDILKFVDASKNGIIVVSFGSVVRTMSEEHIRKLEVAFKQLKYDVIWKHSDSSFSAPNVYVTNWLPQNDLLGHPKTKLFITHCGNNGQFEALYHAVPMLGFPVFADQPYNGYRIQVKGYGISMDCNDYKVDQLVKNIKEIIENPKYKSNIKKASEIFRSRPEHPAAKGARHIDHIIKFGGAYMRSHCQDMPLYQYFMLDIFAVLALVIIVAIVIVIVVTRKCCKLFTLNKSKSD